MVDYEALDSFRAATSVGEMSVKHREGTGPTFIFIHGLGASAKTWKGLADALPETYNLYLIDLLGHGESNAEKIDYKVSVQVRAVKEFIENEHLAEGYLVGASLGGWIAALLAQDPPANFKFAGLILIDPAGLRDFLDDLRGSGKEKAWTEAILKETLALMPDRKHVPLSTMEQLWTEEKNHLTQESLFKVRRNVPPEKTLIVRGRQDATVPLKYGYAFADYLSGSRLVVIEGAGHRPQLTHPKDVAAQIIELVRAKEKPQKIPQAP